MYKKALALLEALVLCSAVPLRAQNPPKGHSPLITGLFILGWLRLAACGPSVLHCAVRLASDRGEKRRMGVHYRMSAMQYVELVPPLD